MSGAKATVEYVPLSEVRGAPRNPKQHDIGTLHISIERFGFADPPTVNERTGRLVEGHGRIEVLRQMKVAGEPEPRYVRNEGGEWYVPVVRGLSWDTDEEAEAYLIAHNRIGEVGAWRDEALTEVLSDLAAADALDGIGYDAEDVDALLAAAESEVVGQTDPDAAPEPPVEPVTKRDDVWLLGRHRVMCGDATDISDVKPLMNDAQATLLYTDPPYGVEYRGGMRRREALINDEVGNVGFAEFVREALDNALVVCDGNAAWYVWHAHKTAAELRVVLRALGKEPPAQIVWVKNQMAAGFGHYRFKHECCFYSSGEYYGGRDQNTVWEVDRDREYRHPTQKPVKLAEIAFANSSEAGGLVLDLFGGSGSTLIAAEKTNRTCYMMELSEQYIDVICRRYQEYTGTLPILESTGEEHDFAASN